MGTEPSVMGASAEAQELARKISHEVWAKYDDEFGYRSQKQAFNQGMARNFHPENIWSFWTQFDGPNQLEFLRRARLSLDLEHAGSADLWDWLVREIHIRPDLKMEEIA